MAESNPGLCITLTPHGLSGLPSDLKYFPFSGLFKNVLGVRGVVISMIFLAVLPGLKMLASGLTGFLVLQNTNRPSVMYALKIVDLTKRHEGELVVAELAMLRFLLGVTKIDRI